MPGKSWVIRAQQGRLGRWSGTLGAGVGVNTQGEECVLGLAGSEHVCFGGCELSSD